MGVLETYYSDHKAIWIAIFIEFGDTKKCCNFSGVELVPKSRKKLIGALSCMHKGPKTEQTTCQPIFENKKGETSS